MSQAIDHETRSQDDARGESLADYWPLISLVAIAAAAAGAITAHGDGGPRVWMHQFMGFFLCAFAMLKIFDPSGFADGFEMYDVVAKRVRAYGLAYPFVELALGLAYFSMLVPVLTYALTVAVMAVSTVGVVWALRNDLDIHCPCMGSVLQVPLSTVTLVEDLGMGAMAAGMLITAWA